MNHPLDDEIAALSESQRAAMPLVFGVLGAACAEYDIADVLAVICLIGRHPRLLTEAIGLTSDALAGKGAEFERRVRHPGPAVVKDSSESEGS